jgi:hypothetical protein
MSFLEKNGKLAGTFLASIATLLLANVAPVYALDQQGVVSGGSIFLETTIAVAMVFITAMAFSLQIARGYFLRTLEKFTLRLGADIRWLTYVLVRDALIFISFVMGLMVFFPGTFQDYALAVPFMPFSVVAFGAALIVKLYFDADENRQAFRAVTVLVFAGTMLWIFGTIFVTESPLQLSQLPSGVSADGGFWAYVAHTFSSLTNVDLSMTSFYIASAALTVIGLLGFAHPLLHSRVSKSTPKIAQTQSTVSPASFPGTAAAAQSGLKRGQQEVSGSLQSSAEPRRDYVDYIQ